MQTFNEGVKEVYRLTELCNTFFQELYTIFKPCFTIYLNLSDIHLPALLTITTFHYATEVVRLLQVAMIIVYVKSSIWTKIRGKFTKWKMNGN